MNAATSAAAGTALQLSGGGLLGAPEQATTPKTARKVGSNRRQDVLKSRRISCSSSCECSADRAASTQQTDLAARDRPPPGFGLFSRHALAWLWLVDLFIASCLLLRLGIERHRHGRHGRQSLRRGGRRRDGRG